MTAATTGLRLPVHPIAMMVMVSTLPIGCITGVMDLDRCPEDRLVGKEPTTRELLCHPLQVLDGMHHPTTLVVHHRNATLQVNEDLEAGSEALEVAVEAGDLCLAYPVAEGIQVVAVNLITVEGVAADPTLESHLSRRPRHHAMLARRTTKRSASGAARVDLEVMPSTAKTSRSTR